MDYTGLTLEESYGHGWNTPFHPDDKLRAWEAWQRATQHNENYSLKCRLRRADGAYRWWLIRGVPMRGANGEIQKWFGTCTDIEELKQAEEALQRSQETLTEELAVLLEAVPAGVYISHDPDCRHMTGNHAADEILRIPVGNELSLSAPEDIKPIHFRTYKDGRELRLDELPAQRSARGEHIKDFEFTLAFDDGLLRHVLGYGTPLFDEQGSPRGSVAILVDITARKRAEEALWESQQQFAALIQNVESGVALIDADGKFTVVNPRFLQMFGLEDAPDNILNVNSQDWSAWQVFDEDGVLLHVDAHPVRKAVLTGRTVKNQLVGMRLPAGGDMIWMLSSAEPMLNADGGIDRVICTYHDITERKRAEETLREAVEALQVSLRETEVLLKEIHHRVKNNMQVISSLVSLQSDTLDDPALRPLFNDLSYRVRAMALVHEKLYQSKSLAEIDFAAYTRSLLNYLWHMQGDAAAAVRLTLDVQPVPISIEQAVPCGLIVNELVTNALKHAFCDRTDGELTVTLHADTDGQVCLGVRDNGVGLPVAWRQSPSLGLQLVQILAGQVHGTLDVRTDGGTSFALTFALPASRRYGEDRHA